MTKTPGREFYDRQIAFLEAADVDGLMENQYHEDAILVSFDNIIRGREALHTYFVGYLEHVGGIKLKSTDKFTEIEDAIFFEATVDAGIGEAKVFDVFALRDGKIFRHFTGVISVKPKDAQT